MGIENDVEIGLEPHEKMALVVWESAPQQGNLSGRPIDNYTQEIALINENVEWNASVAEKRSQWDEEDSRRGYRALLIAFTVGVIAGSLFYVTVGAGAVFGLFYGAFNAGAVRGLVPGLLTPVVLLVDVLPSMFVALVAGCVTACVQDCLPCSASQGSFDLAERHHRRGILQINEDAMHNPFLNGIEKHQVIELCRPHGTLVPHVYDCTKFIDGVTPSEMAALMDGISVRPGKVIAYLKNADTAEGLKLLLGADTTLQINLFDINVPVDQDLTLLNDLSHLCGEVILNFNGTFPKNYIPLSLIEGLKKISQTVNVNLSMKFDSIKARDEFWTYKHHLDAHYSFDEQTNLHYRLFPKRRVATDLLEF